MRRATAAGGTDCAAEQPSDRDRFGVGLLGIGPLGREAELDLLALAPASAQPPYVAVRSAVTYVAGADRDQGLPKPEGRVAPGPRHRSPERDELGFGVLVTLLLAADLLRRALGSVWVR